MSRCPRCYRRVEADFLFVHVCPSTAPRPQRSSAPRTVYVRPSRPRIPRADWLASVAVTDEQRRATNAAKQARYRTRKKAAAS